MGELRYTPYGETRYATGAFPTDRRYTGQREEAGLGLYDYGARFYDPLLARFISADTIVPSPSSPQSLNRYSYCLGNPVRYRDPTGHYIFEEDWIDPTASFGSYFLGPREANRIYGKSPDLSDYWTRQTQRPLKVSVPMRVSTATLIDPHNEGGRFIGAFVLGILQMASSRGPMTFGGPRINAPPGLPREDYIPEPFQPYYPAIEPPSYHGGLRENMLRQGKTPPPGMQNPEVHHDLPWAYKDWFAEAGRGLDVNDPQFGRWVERNVHRGTGGWSPDYTQEWKTFIRGKPNASRLEVLQFLNELLNSGRFPSQ